MKKIVKWFSTNNKTYYGAFECEKHGLVKGRLRVKQSDDGKYYAVRIMKFTDDCGVKKIKLKQNKEREHRQMKRHMHGKETGEK